MARKGRVGSTPSPSVMETIYKKPESKFKKLTKAQLKEAVSASKSLAECLAKLDISSTQSTRLKLTILLRQKQIDCSSFANDIECLDIAKEALEHHQRQEDKKRLLRIKRSRADFLNPIKVAKWIVQDCRKKDKKAGLQNDLTRELVEPLISVPCNYCGETKLRMSLDRKDNNRGHLLENVVGCCRRCNDIRGSMPYEAWLHIVPAIRSTRELGLFDGWLPGNKSKIVEGLS